MSNYFKAFNIIFFPRFINVVTDALENSTTRMSPLRNGFSIEIIYKPFVPNNVTKFCVFNDDQQILYFMASAYVSKDVVIDEDVHDKALQEAYNAM